MTRKFGSDVMVDAIKACGFKYVSLNPGSSYRGLHDSMVNYGENEPQIITANHEKLAVSTHPRNTGSQPHRDLPLLLFIHGSTTIRISAPDKNRTCARGLGNPA